MLQSAHSSSTGGSSLPGPGEADPRHLLIGSSINPVTTTLIGSLRVDGDDESSIVAAKEAGFHMRRAIDEDNLKDALRHASTVLWEIRVSSLSHPHYFQLYCCVTDEMSKLDAYFSSPTFRFRGKYARLYETVQHAGNAAPRVYLMILVAKQLIGSAEVPSSLVLQDLCRIVKIVQHPLRGLYTRFFLIQQLSERINQAIIREEIPLSPENQPANKAEESVVDDSCNNRSEAVAKKTFAGQRSDDEIAEALKCNDEQQALPPQETAVHLSDDAVQLAAPAEAQVENGRVTATTGVTEAAANNVLSDSRKKKMVVQSSVVNELGTDGSHLKTSCRAETSCRADTSSSTTQQPMDGTQNNEDLLVRDLSLKDAFDFYFDNIEACNKLLTRLGYLEGGGVQGKEVRVQYSFIIKSLVAKLADLKTLTMRFFCDTICPRYLGLVESLKDPLSPIFLLQSFIDAFPSKYLVLRLGNIVSLLFGTNIQNIATLFESLNARFEQQTLEGELEFDKIPRSVTEAIESELKDLVHEALKEFSIYIGALQSEEVPQSVAIPPLVQHWALLLKSIEMVLPLCLRHDSMLLSESIKLLLLHFSGSLDSIIEGVMAPEVADLVNRARTYTDKKVITESLGNILTALVITFGVNAAVADLTTEMYNVTPDDQRPVLSTAILKGLNTTDFANLHAPATLAHILSIATPYAQDQAAVQNLAKLCHRLVVAGDTDLSFTLLALVRAACNTLNQELVNSAPILTALVVEVCRIATTVAETEVKHANDEAALPDFDSCKLLQFVHGCCVDLQDLHPKLAFSAALLAAATADDLETLLRSELSKKGTYQAAATEFLSNALSVYEVHYSHSRDDYSGILHIIAFILKHQKCTDTSTFEDLVVRICTYAAKLLRKQEQCRAILRCASLFWNDKLREEQRVAECVNRALTIAESLSMISGHETLFDEIRAMAQYYREDGVANISERI